MLQRILKKHNDIGRHNMLSFPHVSTKTYTSQKKVVISSWDINLPDDYGLRWFRYTITFLGSNEKESIKLTKDELGCCLPNGCKYSFETMARWRYLILALVIWHIKSFSSFVARVFVSFFVFPRRYVSIFLDTQWKPYKDLAPRTLAHKFHMLIIIFIYICDFFSFIIWQRFFFYFVVTRFNAVCLSL